MQSMRRLRGSTNLRGLVRETKLNITDLVYPIVVVHGEMRKNRIAYMPGIYQCSIDILKDELKRIWESGIRSIMVIGIPIQRDDSGSEAYNKHGIAHQAISYIKSAYPDMVVIADLCLSDYISCGVCSIEMLPSIAKAAVALAQAGADIIAPSDMLDGRAEIIRNALDENGFEQVAVMAYSTKYASAYSVPFGESMGKASGIADNVCYQIDYANKRDAMQEIQEDIDEGADIVMINPALTLLDIINEASHKFSCPIAAFNTGGEYAMVKAAAANGWLNEKNIVMENLTAIKRAGADIIITYYALEAAQWMKEEI